MPNSLDINVLSTCAELLDALDTADATRILQYLSSRYADATTIKKKRGRPSSLKSISLSSALKKKRGRPRKNQDPNVASLPKKGRGRPKKIKTDIVSTPKKGRGRPKKQIMDITPAAKKKGRGRPRKISTVSNTSPKKRGRPALITSGLKFENQGRRGRPRKNVELIIPKMVKKRGRPAKKKKGRPSKIA
ncbi:MAG: hypothetical protein KA143_03765 [Saprospiraceae bacterium]|nr:hypothetical protein [Saprospiraceae bacterium]